MEELKNQDPFDIFISFFSVNDRVKSVFDKILAKEKYWIILREFDYNSNEIPLSGQIYQNELVLTESELIIDCFQHFNFIGKLERKNICIDLSGIPSNYVVFLFRYLKFLGILNLTAIYSDPLSYIHDEKTSFSNGQIMDVRQIALCEGQHNPDTSNDYLIIAAGYDSKSIKSVSASKGNAKKIPLYGFPPLQPHMFQENVLQVIQAKESIGGQDIEYNEHCLFAPANDPFVTAQILSDYIKMEESRNKITNLYLCPLSTKAHTLGFYIYYNYECMGKAVSILSPIYNEYNKKTTLGIARINEYKVEL